MTDEEGPEYETGPYCIHWCEPGDCDHPCLREGCKHRCDEHRGAGECKVEGCLCQHVVWESNGVIRGLDE